MPGMRLMDPNCPDWPSFTSSTSSTFNFQLRFPTLYILTLRMLFPTCLPDKVTAFDGLDWIPGIWS